MTIQSGLIRVLLLLFIVFSPISFASTVHQFTLKAEAKWDKFNLNKPIPAFYSSFKKQPIDDMLEFMSENTWLKTNNGVLNWLCQDARQCMDFRKNPGYFSYHKNRRYNGKGHIGAEVPLPAAVWLFGSGLIALGFVGVRKHGTESPTNSS